MPRGFIHISTWKGSSPQVEWKLEESTEWSNKNLRSSATTKKWLYNDSCYAGTTGPQSCFPRDFCLLPLEKARDWYKILRLNRIVITSYIYGSFHGRFTVNTFFFDEIFFFCLLTSKIIDTFFFQCDTWKSWNIIFLSLALGKIVFF